ncbi:MAG TPA: HNH endonuclease signature motif containing protein [Bacteriovoracaceae bacterium]|nr:HNH endonuclease signature motif containing protein [Bacteriovoracaceae bacterium]
MKFTNLSDDTLLNEMLFWANKEREALSNVLWRLKEIDERKLYSAVKCGSLFDYCVKVLKYSEGQASRRVSACRLLQQLPEISVQIENGELNITQLNQAKQFFTAEEINSPEIKKEVLKKIIGKTTRETERILWDLKKVEGPRKVSILLKEETVFELRKLQALKAHSYPDMDALLMKMSLDFAKLWDPTTVHRKTRITGGHSRYVQVQVKAEVWERDNGQCSNCGTNHGLEVDHIKPFGAGGKTPRFLESCPVEVKSIIYRDSYNLGAARAEKKSFP